MKFFIFAVVLEVIGVIIAGVGIGIEVVMRAHIGFVLISGGSLILAAGSLIFAKFAKLPHRVQRV